MYSYENVVIITSRAQVNLATTFNKRYNCCHQTNMATGTALLKGAHFKVTGALSC